MRNSGGKKRLARRKGGARQNFPFFSATALAVVERSIIRVPFPESAIKSSSTWSSFFLLFDDIQRKSRHRVPLFHQKQNQWCAPPTWHSPPSEETNGQVRRGTRRKKKDNEKKRKREREREGKVHVAGRGRLIRSQVIAFEGR